MSEFKSCIFIMADGCRADVFSELLKSGDLPNISKYLVERGCYKEAVTVFPSTTGPAYTPYILGKYPGRCNLPGIRWFDRNTYNDKLLSFDRFRSYIGLETYFMNRDISLDYKTLFEIFPRSVNIFNELSRGVSYKNDKTYFSKLFYKVKSHFTDRSNEVDLVAQRILLQSLKEYSEYTYAVFLGIDTYSHLYHPFHKKVIDSYRRVDDTIGLLAKNLESEGRLEETLIIVASDHGLTQTHSHFDSLEFMNTKGYKTFYYPNVFKHFTDADAACLISGNAMANIYVKSKDGWGRKSTFEELRGLADNFMERPEIDIVAGLDEEGRSRIISTKGEALAWLDPDGTVNYEKISGDPFSYNGMPKKMSSEEALTHSFNTEYPDALLQIIQLLESPRTGDLVLSAAPGYDLRAKHENPEHRSSHGALFRDHMVVPLVMNTKVKKEYIRTVDIFPTILSILGHPVPNNIDGISLVD